MYKLYTETFAIVIQKGVIMLTKQLAEDIVEQTMIRLNRNLNVMDTNGMILASGETDRIERIHEGAAFVAKKEEVLWITKDNLTDWYGTKPGVNMPVYFQQKLIGVIGITGERKELKDIATLVQLTTEMMIHQSLITSRAEWIRKMKELIFEELTGSEPPSPLVEKRLALLNFNVMSPYVTLLIESNYFSPSSQRIIEQLEDQFEKDSVLIGHSQLNKVFILLSGYTNDEVKVKLSKLLHLLQKDDTARIGVGVAVNSINDIRYSYTTAKNALQYGKAEHQLIHFEDIELVALLKRNPQPVIDHFSSRILKGLNDQLLKTLSVYFECNNNNSTTSSTLMIHRHTLTYRFKKIEEITGYNPTIFKDAILLNIALLLK
jgi:carbohydrate diacid regulator